MIQIPECGEKPLQLLVGRGFSVQARQFRSQSTMKSEAFIARMRSGWPENRLGVLRRV